MDANQTVSDLLNQAAALAFSAAPLASDKDNAPAIEFLAEHLRDIASDEAGAEAAKPIFDELPSRLREWADRIERIGLDAADVEKMGAELKATASLINKGWWFLGTVSNRAGNEGGK